MAAPIISINTENAKGGESLIINGDLTNVNNFYIWGVGRGVRQCTIALDTLNNKILNNEHAVVVLPSDLPYDYYALWAVNDAGEVSNSVHINRARIMWLQTSVRPGQKAQIFGRNLAANRLPGANNARVYFAPTNGGNSIEAVVTEVNPYRIQYTVPTLTAGVNYNVYVHNTHGGAYGLSEPRVVTAAAAITWGQQVAIGVRQAGDVSDVERFERAFAAANTANNFRVITFNETLYFHRRATVTCRNTKLLGGGKTTAQIIPGTTSTDSTFTGAGLLSLGTNCVNLHFENLTFDLKNRTVNKFSDGFSAKFSNGLNITNCNLHFAGVQPLNIENSNNTILQSVHMIGATMYVGNANQTFMYSCTLLQTNDANTAIGIWNGEGFMCLDTISRDLDPSGDMNSDATFGMGRMITGNGGHGGQLHWHIERCRGELMTPRAGTASDPNSGEIFMWEGNLTRGSSKAEVVSSDGLTLTFNHVKSLDTIGRSWVLIVGGKGRGQYRRVVSRTANTVTVDSDWAIRPDATSTIMVGHYSFNIVSYNNYGSAKPYANGSVLVNGKDYVCASSGYKPYGGCIENVCDSCTFEGTRTGIQTFVTVHNVVGQGSWPGYEPVYWNYYANNSLINNKWGFEQFQSMNHDAEKLNTSAIYGTTFRSNIIDGALESELSYASSADLNKSNAIQIFEHNQSNTWVDLAEPRGGAESQTFRNNTRINRV